MALLSVQNVTMRFGGLLANDAISFDVPEGDLFAVIGPNGAGKTTLFNIISGFFPPTEGSVDFDGRPTSPGSASSADRGARTRAHLPTRAAVQGPDRRARTSQVGFHRVTRGGIAARAVPPALGPPSRRPRSSATRASCSPSSACAPEADVPADKLPYGQQRLLEVARALAAEPRLLLLDEPAAGLNTQETEALADVIQRVNARGVTVLLDRARHGPCHAGRAAASRCSISAARSPRARRLKIKAHPDVIAAYLGGTESADA